MPTKSTLAKLNKLHYKISDGSEKDKKKALKKVDKIGYEVVSHKRGVAHFKSKNEDDRHNVVAVKGTDPTNKQDLMSDLHLAIGQASTDKQFKNRKKQIKKIYSSIDDKEDKHLTGHSLGSSVITHTLAKSKSVRDNTKTAHAFNTGMTPSFNKELQKDLSKQDKKDLKAKLVHHHVKGDPISAALTVGGQIGRVKTTKQTAASPHSLDNHHSDKTIKDKDEEEPKEE
jgi:hypothetical protein